MMLDATRKRQDARDWARAAQLRSRTCTRTYAATGQRFALAADCTNMIARRINLHCDFNNIASYPWSLQQKTALRSAALQRSTFVLLTLRTLFAISTGLVEQQTPLNPGCDWQVCLSVHYEKGRNYVPYVGRLSEACESMRKFNRQPMEKDQDQTLIR